MRLQDFVSDLACFLFQDRGDGRGQVPNATAFFVSYPVGPEISAHYLVTALHVANESARMPLVARLRYADDSNDYYELAIPRSSWFTPETATADVAVCRISEDELDVPRPLAHRSIEHRMFLERSDLASAPPGSLHSGLGAETFSVGLMALGSGTYTQVPVVRFGHIAMLPSPRAKVPVRVQREPLDEYWTIEAFLVEAASWGGQSGAPVFLNHEMSGGMFYSQDWKLVGVNCAHFDLHPRAEVQHKHKDATNAGMSIVTPAWEIRALLEQEDVAEDRCLWGEKAKGRRSDADYG